MRPRRTLAALLALPLALALCAGPGLAQPGPPDDGGPPFGPAGGPGPPGGPPGARGGPEGPGIERVLERNAERLHLDEETRARIRALAVESRDRTRPQRDALHRLHDELHALLSADAPALDAVMEKADEIGRAETALQKERLRTMLAIRALLTSEQRRELVRIHEEFRAQHGRWGERGSGEGRPGFWRDRGERE